MVDITQVKQLREITGAGMMDCKKALIEANDDLDKAIDFLRKKGIALAAKKGGRTASEGLVGLEISENSASIIELNSETDFVAKNNNFIKLAKQLISANLKATKNTDLDNLDVAGISSKEAITNAISTIGENIKLRRAVKLANDKGFVASYVHNKIENEPSLGKIAVLVSADCSNITQDAKNLIRQVAMHIAAQKPLATNIEEVPTAYVEKEKEIFTERAKASGKPDNIIEKMVEGRIRKYYQETVLVEQAFVMDGKTLIKDVIAQFNKDNNSDLKINSFIRYEVGEGIEKKQDNFAKEAQEMASN